MTPASPRHDGERSPNGLAVGDPEALAGPRSVTRLREILQPEQDPDGDPDPADQVGESVDAAQRRRAADEWLRRRLLERQLHDGASLRISALALRLGLLRPPVPGKDEDWQDRIVELQDELHAVLQELRDVAGKIYPPLLDQAGLAPALRELADQIGVELDIEVRKPAKEQRFGPVAEGAAYFAVAECLTERPTGRDVGAPELRVRIDRDQGDLVLAVAGVGARHLNYMLDQARPLGGSADLAEGGTPETGTITVRIPCK